MGRMGGEGGQEEWWGDTAREGTILGSLREFREFAGLPSCCGMEPWHWLKSRLDCKENRNLPRVVPSPILSPVPILSLRDKEFM